jgi:hypothetical protein
MQFLFFPCLKEKLPGLRFQSAEEIVTATWDLPVSILQQCFQQLYQCWQTCIATNGNNFEGWSDKTIVHKIIDCSSIHNHRFINIIYMYQLPSANLLCPLLSVFQLFLCNCIRFCSSETFLLSFS